jgi:hypothetical protein
MSAEGHRASSLMKDAVMACIPALLPSTIAHARSTAVCRLSTAALDVLVRFVTSTQAEHTGSHVPDGFVDVVSRCCSFRGL